jgi:laminin alpha 3/5
MLNHFLSVAVAGCLFIGIRVLVQVEFEYGNEQQLAKVLPGVYDNSTGLVYLDQTDSMIDVSGKVPHPGQYVFVVHYYQPNHPGK